MGFESVRPLVVLCHFQTPVRSEDKRPTELELKAGHGNARKATPPYSARSVIAGSTRAARHAGTEQAIADTAASSPTTPTYVVGSGADTPNSIAPTARLAIPAPANPITIPREVSVIPCLATRPTMSARD